MKNKVVIGLVAVVAVVAIFVIAKSVSSKKTVKAKPGRAAPAKAAARAPAAPVKKAISKDKGGLTVKILNSRNMPAQTRIRAFRSIDNRSSVYAASFAANIMQELEPGTYDLEMDLAPQRIYKNVNVVKGRENIEELGCLTGSLNVKALNAKKKDAYYPVRIYNSKTREMAMAGSTNRSLEIMPAIYDIEIDTLPRQVKKNVMVEKGREKAVDVGCIVGGLTVKAYDENKKETRQSARVLQEGAANPVATISTNRPVELVEGAYKVEILSTPRQTKEVKINTGEDSVVEFTVQAAAPQPPARPRK